MYNSIQNSLIIGKKVIYLPSCHSTNDIAAELVQNGLAEEGTVVITDNQTGGRGQRGTTWISEPGMNLTFSLVLKPNFLPIDQQFLISQTVALALYDFLSHFTVQTKIKWPNDIYVTGKKISGTLIENSIQGAAISNSIIGIGINMNQRYSALDRTTSVASVTGIEVDLKGEFERLMRLLDARYNRLKTMDVNDEIRSEYLWKLYGYQQPVTFNYQNERIKGVVTGVADNGRLLIHLEGQETVLDFGMKEIEWVWDN